MLYQHKIRQNETTHKTTAAAAVKSDEQKNKSQKETKQPQKNRSMLNLGD